MIIGAAIGNWLGSLLPEGAPRNFFSYPLDWSLGYSPEATLINFYVIKIKTGVQFNFNPVSLVGGIVAWRLYYQYR